MNKNNSAKIKKIKFSGSDRECIDLILKDLVDNNRVSAAHLLMLVLDKYFEL